MAILESNPMSKEPENNFLEVKTTEYKPNGELKWTSDEDLDKASEFQAIIDAGQAALKKELREKIAEMKVKHSRTANSEIGDGAYNAALDQVLDLLKE